MIPIELAGYQLGLSIAAAARRGAETRPGASSPEGCTPRQLCAGCRRTLAAVIAAREVQQAEHLAETTAPPPDTQPKFYARCPRRGHRLEREEKVRILEQLARGAAIHVLAAEHGVSRATLYEVLHGRLWPELPRPPELAERARHATLRTEGARARWAS